MLTNAGLIYFKVDEMKKEEDLEPQNFKPLNDFVISTATIEEAKKQFAFKVVFCKQTLMQRDILLAAPTERDMTEWINAFRLHQIDTIEARSKFLEKKLQKVGVNVPRATVLIEQGQVPGLLGAISSQATLNREALSKLGHGKIEDEEAKKEESSDSEDQN